MTSFLLGQIFSVEVSILAATTDQKHDHGPSVIYVVNPR